ncbi:MAG: sulfur carrier protein ThiS [Candidatus Cloacimonadaceae bacterium]|nr:sulfur carrier protein ThiS [Candidatus Cloacimonadaceae bacterium]MDP3114796.1 sulfur carrier protein ThiS [Candidatus Cloacimonadaceae bacterium]
MNTITVNGNIIDWEDGMTVRDVLIKMNYTFRMLVIKIDGVLVKKVNYDITPVPVGADVMVYHLISGG